MGLTPKLFLMLKHSGPVAVGEKIDFQALGWEPDPRKGPIPVLTVEAVTAAGGISVATFECVGCKAKTHVHPGDIFQKRKCPACQASSSAGKFGGGGAVLQMGADVKAALLAMQEASKENKASQDTNAALLLELKELRDQLEALKK